MTLIRTRGRHQRPRPVRAAAAALATALGISSLALLATANPAAAVTNAVSTSTNVPTTGACLHGNPDPNSVNCNMYAEKKDVWLSGLPSTLGDDSYFFAVLEPGSQHDPNDGGEGNLSDTAASSDPDSKDTGSGDADDNRRFKLENGVIVADGGSHAIENDKIQLIPYDDTSNPGGVYILAVCAWNDGNAVDPSDCKYDAFKVAESVDPCPLGSTDPFCLPEDNPGAPLTVSKTAVGSYDQPYTWGITKTHDAPVYGPSSATIDYDITVTSAQGAPDNRTVSGVISIGNTNDAAIPTTVSDVVTIDWLDPNVSNTSIDCVVEALPTGIDGSYVPAGGAELDYSCALPDQVGSGDVVSNTVTINWSDSAWNSGGQGYFLMAGTDDDTKGPIGFTATKHDECVNVTDKFGADAATVLDGSVCHADTQPSGLVIADQKVVTYPQSGCVTVTNRATYTSNDQDAMPTGYADDSVEICRPYAPNGARTMGFWQNKNGQTVIGSAPCTTLRNWLAAYAPFSDAPAAPCDVKKYALNVIKAAEASGASMNKMLKAQMLATALDVYFTGSGKNSTSAKFFGANPVSIGGATVDLNNVCANPGACTVFQDVGAAFGGADALTVSQLLTYAAGQSDAGGVTWYGNVKATQALAKNTFDAINNNVTYAP